MSIKRQAIAEAYLEACRAELQAPKPGNVHVFASGHEMEARHFLDAANASAGPLTEPGRRVGMRILDAVVASMQAAGTNTNLGIILLAAPLAAAAETHADLREGLRSTLASLDRDDALHTFRAITTANPGGMGTEAVNDIRGIPSGTLREAMDQAQHRDRIARAYVTDFADCWTIGLPALADARRAEIADWWPATAVHLAFLAAFSDSHIARKWGAEAADWVQRQAIEFLARQRQAGRDREQLMTELLALDHHIKDRGLNPGTSADLTVATLFAARLLTILRK